MLRHPEVEVTREGVEIPALAASHVADDLTHRDVIAPVNRRCLREVGVARRVAESDPDQIDDAALAAARYLCASGPVTTVEGWRAAVFSYNHLETYVNDVAAAANHYAARAG